MPGLRRHRMGLRKPHPEAVDRPAGVRMRRAPARPAAAGEVPRLPEDFIVDLDKDGWRR
jgi:hypothetical protein